eukprot:TRINITY_DN4944_c0_g1_i1.p2 TRINITY_DN4944_c0_g1~~TRINITY_DN4944_c0_g1_i1.p2  ORF type:complete len:244 (+),score=88.83 TRINITY_DN4944_c0_g1_i1:64-795(+)
MAGRLTVTLYYDCLSPFSFLAFTVLQRYKQVWNMDLQLRPVLLGGVMASTGNQPPAMRKWAPATMKVAQQESRRNLVYYNVPQMQTIPRNFFGPDGPADPRGLARDFRYMRMLTVVRQTAPEALEAATRNMFNKIWVDGRVDGAVPITEDVLRKVCTDAGLSEATAADIVSRIGNADTKSAVKASVAEAVKHGAYGAPFMRVNDGSGEQVFFGADRFESMAVAFGLPWHGPDPARPTTTSPRL